jgi:hypothetical protein
MMDTTFTNLLKDFQTFNDRLFMEIGSIVTSIEPSTDTLFRAGVPSITDTIDIYMLSKCGSACYEISLDRLSDLTWPEDLYQVMISNSDLMSELRGCQFMSFSKSELFRSICREIIYPIQILSDFSPFGREQGGIAIEAEEIILTGIHHVNLEGENSIEYISGAIPAADEFCIWRDELACFEKPDSFTLSECIALIASRILELGEYKFTVEDLKKVVSPQFFEPQNSQELWKMHRLMGTGRSSIWN